MTAKPTHEHLTGSDWDRLNGLQDEDIERMALADTENPATKTEDWAQATIGLPNLKVPIAVHFDAEVVEWFRRQGQGYEARMNAVLRRHMDWQRKQQNR